VRDIAASKRFTPGQRWRKSVGKLGPASPVRHLVKGGKLVVQSS
jgi:hypothetical protein